MNWDLSTNRSPQCVVRIVLRAIRRSGRCLWIVLEQHHHTNEGIDAGHLLIRTDSGRFGCSPQLVQWPF